MDIYQVFYQRHAVERMALRGVTEEDVIHVLFTGETIRSYPDDTPFPSELLLGWCERRPIHVVVATDIKLRRKIVVTVYEPDPDQWEDDFRRKKR